MGTWTESFLWASLIWGAIGSGYTAYGWKQRSLFPFAGGAVMIAMSCFCPALPMTIAGVVIMFGVWWLVKQGY